jgi:hypothetical protein
MSVALSTFKDIGIIRQMDQTEKGYLAVLIRDDGSKFSF